MTDYKEKNNNDKNVGFGIEFYLSIGFFDFVYSIWARMLQVRSFVDYFTLFFSNEVEDTHIEKH